MWWGKRACVAGNMSVLGEFLADAAMPVPTQFLHNPRIVGASTLRVHGFMLHAYLPLCIL